VPGARWRAAGEVCDDLRLRDGQSFRQRVAAIVDSFRDMKEDLDSEKRATVARWNKRDKQIERIAMSTAALYGTSGDCWLCSRQGPGAGAGCHAGAGAEGWGVASTGRLTVRAGVAGERSARSGHRRHVRRGRDLVEDARMWSDREADHDFLATRVT